MNGTGSPAAGVPLVLGTTNAHKLVELGELLAPFAIPCTGLDGLAAAVTVEETGDTFAANAMLKATAQARALGSWVLAEDSGLVVPALGGAPGVFSARYSGPVPPGATGSTDERNNDRLLAAMVHLSPGDRAAHYACHAVLADPTGRVVATAEGRCQGVIAQARQGRGGFGYDPLFVVTEYHRTFGELPGAVKALISHRARAIRRIVPAIVRHLAAGLTPPR